MLKIESTDSPVEVLSWCQAFLEDDPINGAVALGPLKAMALEGRAVAGAYFAAVFERGRPVAVVVHPPERIAILVSDSAVVASAVAVDMFRKGFRPLGVLASAPAASGFSDEWAACTRSRVQRVDRLCAYRLELGVRERPEPRMPVELRPVSVSTVATVVPWLMSFLRDAGLPNSREAAEEFAATYIRLGGLHCSYDHSRAVGLVALASLGGSRARISAVYVPEEFRGCGYGRATVAELLRQLSNGGIGDRVSEVFLETQSSNAAARALYQGLGFARNSADREKYMFEYAK